jgi:MarR family transcriptional regulator for hemolysin
MQNTQNISALLQHMSPAKSLGFLIQDVARLLRREMDQKAQKLGLTSAQWRILAHVSRCELLNQEPLNQASLAELLDMEPITLSRHIDRIQAAGLIERRPHPSDRRAHQLFLTDSARPLVTSFRAVGQEVLALALAGVSEEEIQQLITLIARIRTNLTGKSEEERSADADGRQQAAPTNQAETRRVS